MSFSDPLTALPGVGRATADKLARLVGGPTVGDLIRHLPSRYRRLGPPAPVNTFAPGEVARVQVRFVETSTFHARRVKITEATGVDETGTRVSCTWFNQPWLERQLAHGEWVISGPLKSGRTPKIDVREYMPADDYTPGLMPVYPLTEGVGFKTLRNALHAALERIPADADPLPADMRDRRDLLDLASAYRAIHRPECIEQAHDGRRRLAFNELFIPQLVLALVRHHAQDQRAPSLSHTHYETHIVDALPFVLSPGQDRVWRRLATRLSATDPSRVLVQGEVGAGKTVIAGLALARAVAHGHSAALLAPTEVLARQHARSLAAMLAPAGIEVVLLVGSLGAAERRAAHARLASGDPLVAVGTQALLGTEQAFQDQLAVLVVDEQHRFGVSERYALAGGVHLLQLTATPIPRSLALTAYGDLDVLTLPERPAAQRQVHTTCVTPRDWPAMVRAHVDAGGAGFVVCPRIGDAEGGVLAAELRAQLDGLRLATAHGRMPQAEREAALAALGAGDADVLLATTVIEVGIDIPRASVIVILDADAFGLAQLHQLRGRVGRAGQPSECLLVPSAEAGPEQMARLELFCATTDGLALAEADLASRGAGDLAGMSQSGAGTFRVVRLDRDRRLVAEARHEARRVVRADPTLADPAHQALRALVRRRLERLSGLRQG